MRAHAAKYVIWSEEHGQWWRPGEFGYTRSLRKAGRYTIKQAERICAKANLAATPPAFNEIAIPDPCAEDQHESATAIVVSRPRRLVDDGEY
jgi:hypothetical protein